MWGKDCQMTVKAEVGVIFLLYKSRKAKDCWQPPESKSSKKGFFPTHFRGGMALLIT